MVDKTYLTTFLFGSHQGVLKEEVTKLSSKVVKGLQHRLRDSCLAVSLVGLESIANIIIWGNVPSEDKVLLYDALCKSMV